MIKKADIIKACESLGLWERVRHEIFMSSIEEANKEAEEKCPLIVALGKGEINSEFITKKLPNEFTKEYLKACQSLVFFDEREDNEIIDKLGKEIFDLVSPYEIDISPAQAQEIINIIEPGMLFFNVSDIKFTVTIRVDKL
jgi:hypothetical protein